MNNTTQNTEAVTETATLNDILDLFIFEHNASAAGLLILLERDPQHADELKEFYYSWRKTERPAPDINRFDAYFDELCRSGPVTYPQA